MPQSISQLKRTVRQFKKMEIRIRFKNRLEETGRPLIWNTFFSTKTGMDDEVTYPLAILHKMNRDELKLVYEAFFYQIYFQHFQDYRLSIEDIYDPSLLTLLGLPPYVRLQDIKQRYRELAQLYHPDHGGAHEKFIELVGVYEQLRGKA
jgi:hypothetical protein